METFLTMGAIYFVAMLAGAFGYRIPPPGWNRPRARAPRADHRARGLRSG